MANFIKFHFFRDVSRERVVFTSSTFTFWGKSSTKASFSRLHRVVFLRMFRRIAAFSRLKGGGKIRLKLFDVHVIFSKRSLRAGLWIIDGGRGFDSPLASATSMPYLNGVPDMTLLFPYHIHECFREVIRSYPSEVRLYVIFFIYGATIVPPLPT